MKPGDIFWPGMLLLVVGGCALVRSTRFGLMAGDIEAADGDHDIAALTLSVEPFAAMEPEPGPSEQQVGEALAQRDAALLHVAELEYQIGLHTCAPCTVEHVEVRWWQDAAFLAWVLGVIGLILSYVFRRPLGAVAAKMGVGKAPTPEA